MGTGWRRAFCTSIPRDRDAAASSAKHHSPSSRSCSSLSFFSGGGGSCNPSTPRLPSSTASSPRLRCRTTSAKDESPRLLCRTTPESKSPRLFQSSNPNSPRSPSRFSLFKSSLRLSRSNCGICSQNVKTGQGTAIFTAECAHAFHFPCIAAHVRKERYLVCPVCATAWRDAPILAVHRNNTLSPPPEAQLKNSNSAATIAIDGIKAVKTHVTSSSAKAYDDDEPIMSPKARQFNPIPEVEDEDDDVAEFQGFFASTAKAERAKGGDGVTGGRKLETFLLPEAAVVSSGRGHETYAVMLRVRAPPAPRAAPPLDPARRAPVDLVTVLDVSGSMTGVKLQMLKRAMLLVVGSLGAADRLSIVAFSAHARRLTPLSRMTPPGQRAARRAIDRLACGRGTCVADALRKARKVLEDRRERNPVASIILLSDAHGDRGASAARGSHPSPRASSTRFAHVEIPVHELGFGRGAESHMPAEDAFAKCVGGLLSVVAQDLRVRLGSAPGEITAVYSAPRNGRPCFLGSGSAARLGNLYAEEERDLIVEMRVPHLSAASAGAHHVMSVTCSYVDPASHELVSCKDQALLVPRPHAVRSSDPTIERLRTLYLSTKAVAEARCLADPASAHHMLSSARALLLQQPGSSVHLGVLDAELAELNRRRCQQQPHNQIQRRRASDQDENSEPLLTPTSAWRTAEQLAKVAIMRKSLNRVSDLHGFENARF